MFRFERAMSPLELADLPLEPAKPPARGETPGLAGLRRAFKGESAARKGRKREVLGGNPGWPGRGLAPQGGTPAAGGEKPAVKGETFPRLQRSRGEVPARTGELLQGAGEEGVTFAPAYWRRVRLSIYCLDILSRCRSGRGAQVFQLAPQAGEVVDAVGADLLEHLGVCR